MDYYIVFAGIVEVGFSTRLFTAINKAGTSGATKIIIFLSSLGGNIPYGPQHKNLYAFTGCG